MIINLAESEHVAAEINESRIVGTGRISTWKASVVVPVSGQWLSV
jgi:hypothetical protein